MGAARQAPASHQGQSPARDATGNPEGRLRPADFELLLLRNELSSAELHYRYHSAGHYLELLYDRRVEELSAQRWLLQDALRLNARTREDAQRQF